MTNEAQRIAIAEELGAVWIVIGEKPMKHLRMLTLAFNPYYYEAATGDEVPCNPEYMWKHGQIPDYLNDLNAMHEVEKVLLPFASDRWQSYAAWLAYLTPLGGQDHATAAQRAEAFLRTISKWEDGK
jgi:hypothetical protein